MWWTRWGLYRTAVVCHSRNRRHIQCCCSFTQGQLLDARSNVIMKAACCEHKSRAGMKECSAGDSLHHAPAGVRGVNHLK